MAKSSLSIAAALDRRKCAFDGCATCPERIVSNQLSHGCVLPEGGAMCGDLIALERVVASEATTDVLSSLRAVEEPESEHCPDGEHYSLIAPEQAKEIARRLREVLVALRATILEPGWQAMIRTEMESRVREHIPWCIEPRTDAHGAPRISLERTVSLAWLTAGWLEDAVARGVEVELGRYRIKPTDVRLAGG